MLLLRLLFPRRSRGASLSIKALYRMLNRFRFMHRDMPVQQLARIREEEEERREKLEAMRAHMKSVEQAESHKSSLNRENVEYMNARDWKVRELKRIRKLQTRTKSRGKSLSIAA